MHERDTAATHGFVEVLAQLCCLGRADHRTEVELGERICGVLNSEWVAEAKALDYRQVGLKEVGEHAALNNEAWVSRAALLAVLVALLQVPCEEIPLGESPDTPGVQALLLEEVTTTGVSEGRSGLAAIGTATDEGESTDALAADEDVAE